MSPINSLANAFDAAEAPEPTPTPPTKPNDQSTSVRSTPSVPHVLTPPPLPGAARPAVSRRPAPVEHRIDDVVDGYARDLEAFLLRQSPSETVLAAGLLVAVLLASFLLTCVAAVLPIAGFVSFGIAAAFMVLGLRVTLRACARYLAAGSRA